MTRPASATASLLALLAGALACTDPEAPRTGDGVFSRGCPQPGRAFARRLESAAERMPGPDALAAPGDFLLASERAAFVVDAPSATPPTYFYYGGILVDAAAVDDCRPANAERFGELAWALGEPDYADLERSRLRAFRGDSAEILADGSDGGAAVLRVHGADDHFWLADGELRRAVLGSGGQPGPDLPLGLAVDVDYVLEPDSAVLQILAHVRNTEARARTLVVGAVVFPSRTTPARFYSAGTVEIAGFGVRTGVPWVGFGAGEGSYAVALDAKGLSSASIAGVSALVDIDQFVERSFQLAAAGESGDAATMRALVAAGATDPNSAARALQPFAPDTRAYELTPLRGRVRDAQGAGVAGADVQLQRERAGGGWATLDTFRSGADGAFGGEVPDRGGRYRLVTNAPGRDEVVGEPFAPAAPPEQDVVLGPAGALGWTVRDGEGRPLPAKIQLRREGKALVEVFQTTGAGEVPLPPGDYEIAISRGFEYAIFDATAKVDPAATAQVAATLAHVVNTDGWLSYDGHMHAAPSPDSAVPIRERLATIAAEGLDVALSTDHETVQDWSPERDEALRALPVVTGSEVTASIPEHCNAYPLAPDPAQPRFGFVRWYGLDMAQLFAAMRARGAGVVVLNHPRGYRSCSWNCLVDYDRVLGAPRLTDPTRVGLPAGAALWSWDFDAMEVFNGVRDPFADPASPRRTGPLDDWLSFLNHGHRVTAVGGSDAHGTDGVGAVRNYFPGDLAAFDGDRLAAAVKAGRVVISTGAFARVSIGDKGPGDLAGATDGQVELRVHVEALPQVDVARVKVLVNCDEVVDFATGAPDAVVKHDGTVTVPVSRDAHLVVLGFGTRALPRTMEGSNARRVPRFVANALYVDADGDGRWTAPGGKACAYSLP